MKCIMITRAVTSTKKKHEALNQDIVRIYTEKPHSQIFPLVDNLFFRRKEVNLKKLRMKQKERWIQDTQGTLDAYKDLENAQTINFTRVFTHAREPTEEIREELNELTREETSEVTQEETKEVPD